MALSQVAEGATSAANDLNQVVNLLNGTTTNTPVTINGPVAANLAGTSGYMRYVGGIPTPPPTVTNNATGTFTPGPILNYQPVAIPLGYQASNAAYYTDADIAWCPGGPLAIAAASPLSVVPPPTGNGGYICRVHQAGALTINANGQVVTGDTIDYDLRGMVQPAQINGSTGIAITLPFFGTWGFAAAIHATTTGAMNVPWVFVGPASGFSAPGPDAVANNTVTYTGTSVSGISVGGSPGPNGASDQLYFITEGAPSPSFSLDVASPDRTFIACWLIS